MSRPSLTFAAFIEERDRCRDPLYVTTDDILRKGFFCNTNRTWDRVSKQLELLIQGSAGFEASACVILTLRLAGSAGDEEGRGAAVIYAATQGDFAAFLRDKLQFSERKAYRAVVSKADLARVVPEIALKILKNRRSPSLPDLHKTVMGYFRDAGIPREAEFHSLQIAMDLMSYGLVKVEDQGDCPLTTGSRRGMGHVKAWEDKGATVKSLAVLLGDPAHRIQTSMCEYDKYLRWSSGAKMRLRKPLCVQGVCSFRAHIKGKRSLTHLSWTST